MNLIEILLKQKEKKEWLQSITFYLDNYLGNMIGGIVSAEMEDIYTLLRTCEKALQEQEQK